MMGDSQAVAVRPVGHIQPPHDRFRSGPVTVPGSPLVPHGGFAQTTNLFGDDQGGSVSRLRSFARKGRELR
jgi:hypothetical protein